MSLFTRLLKFSSNPWVLLASVAGGIVLGWALPDVAIASVPLGETYLGLLKMVILPFLLSSVTMGFAMILRENALVRRLPRIAMVFLGSMLLAGALGISMALLLGTGSGLSQESQTSMGRVVSGQDRLQVADELEVRLAVLPDPPHENPVGKALRQLIPDNVFQALSAGETLKVLAFTLLFGLAIGRTPGRNVDALLGSLQAIFDACQKVMRWTNLFLPPALCSMVAVQVAQTGTGTMGIMAQFILLNFATTGILWALAFSILWRRGAASWPGTLSALQEPLLIAAGTRNSLAAIPSSIEALTGRFGFPQQLVVLLVPLGTTLCRLGPVCFYGLAGVFIAQMYGIALGPAQLALLLGAAVVVGVASAGTSGVLTLSMVGLVCRPLGLPSEAAVVLFIAVDVVNGVLRSSTNVLGTAAMIALVCEPVRAPAQEAIATECAA